MLTLEQRRIGGKRSGEVRRQQAQELANLRSLPIQRPVQQTPNLDAEELRARIETLNERMSKAKDEDTWDKLSRSYERLFRCWQVLSRTPGPGQLRPETTKRQARYWERPAGAVTDAPTGSVPPTKP